MPESDAAAVEGGDAVPTSAAASAAASAAGAVAAASRRPAGIDGDVDAIWRDPIFRKQFIAGYGVNAEVEPRVTPEDVKVLEKVRPLMADNLPGAEETLREMLKPDGPAILDFTLAGIQFQQDRLAEALANYQKAVAKFPSFRRAYRNIGLIQVREGRHDEAIRAFTKMIELGGGDAYSYGLLGFAYAAKEDYQPAEAAYRQALLLQPENTEWRLGLTRCVFKQGKLEDASTLLDALIVRYPEKADFWLLQAQAYLGMKKPLRAAENLEVVAKLGRASIDSMHTLGDIYLNENLLELAADAYKRAVDVDPKQPLTRPLRSVELLAARGSVSEAKDVSAHIKKARAADMEEGDRRRLLKLEARLGMADGGGGPETIAVLEEIVKLDPLDGEALMLLGQHYAKSSQPDRAIFYYERAESIEAFEIDAKVRHAQILVGMGRHAEAIPLLRRAQEAKPRDTVARYLEQVERISRSKK